METRKRVCYLTSHSPVFSKEVGGAEAQLYLIGQQLLGKGWECHYAINNCGQKNTETIEGMVFHKVRRLNVREIMAGTSHENNPLTRLRNITTSIMANAARTLNFEALEHADADIYHTRCAGKHVGYVGMHAKRRRKPFVFTVAHIDDCTVSGRTWRGRWWLDRRMYLKGLKSADSVIITSEYLREPLEENYRGDVRLIRSGYPIPEISGKPDGGHVLWAARMVDWKHPEIYFEVAKALPEYEFVMLGGGRDFRKTEKFNGHQDMKSIGNLRFIDFVPFKEVNTFFREAAVFVDTSDSAGFPNTFIQSWMHGVPTVSLDVDPDCVICDNRLGYHSKTVDQMVEDVRELMENTALRRKTGRRCREYAVKNHDIKDTAAEHDRLYTGLVEDERS
ncbi:MAG: glycosyltransferase [Candidatus Altiarchaeales archaeon]|nr:glycosyltransferase [Candidatus Altiarchaeales archaeon]MBD3417282.1 glycosyltransferase [Candidatus Altiarchaeales archaeon]